jgi:hypothetical protein
VCADEVVRRSVPGPAQHMEHLGNVVGHDAALLEHAQQVVLAGVATHLGEAS